MIEKRKYISVMINIISFVIQLSINLFITPAIIDKLGTEAYGFIGMSNDFITYLSVVTSIINSVAGRFIAVEICKKNITKANIYFSSVFVVNGILSIAFLVVGGTLISVLDILLDIPQNIVCDVKITFIVTLVSYIVNIVTSVFTTSMYVKDRLEIQGIRNVIQYSVRGILIVVLFYCFTAKIYFISIAALMVSVLMAIYDFIVCKKIMPEAKVNISNSSAFAVKELASSGVLLAITSLSSILLSGLDLLIANKCLGAYEMGLLSTAKTMPNSLTSAVIVVASLFTPGFIMLYSKGKIDLLEIEVVKSMKIVAFIMAVPIVGFIIFSDKFYYLWLNLNNDKEIMIISMLSIFTAIEILFNAITYPLAQLSLVTNKMKIPVSLSLIIGVLNTVIVLILLEFTSCGVYAIALVSSILLIIRYLVFNPWYAAHTIGISAWKFYYELITLTIKISIVSIVMNILKNKFVINSWSSFFGSVLVCGGIGYFIMFILVRSLKKRKEL